jgi:BirA family biotin operon repressor/biotin-[acetyl-CoA-carboxylase] ligase
MDASEMQRRVRAFFPQADIAAYAELPSTMDAARQLLARGAATGSTVFAEVQSSGRGRFDRRWHAAPGLDLAFSTVLAPQRGRAQELPATVLGALAVTRAARHYTVPAAIRWPNDVVTPRGKLAGVLAESPHGMAGCVLGIGLNVNSMPADRPPGLRGTAVSLRASLGRSLPLAAVAERVLWELRSLLVEVEQNGVGVLEAHWARASATLGKRVRLLARGTTHEGVVAALSVADGLTLRLPTPAGASLVFRAEEVELCQHLDTSQA